MSPADTIRQQDEESIALWRRHVGHLELGAEVAVRIADERDALLAVGERDRRQIARLNAIEAAARKVYYGPSKGSQAVKAWGELGAVLADEEDAGG